MNKAKMRAVYARHAADKDEIYDKVMKKADGERFFNRYRLLRPVLAACLAVVLLFGGYSGYALAAEAREYSRAVAFFEQYDLSTDGLTRAEIKAVYKDITMKTYSYAKTLDILNTISIEMYSTELKTLDSDKLDELWNYRNSVIFKPDNKRDCDGVWFETDYSNTSTGTGTTVIKHAGDEVIWSYTIPYDMFVDKESVVRCGDNTLVFGKKDYTGIGMGEAVAFMLDSAGNKIWEDICRDGALDYQAGVYTGNSAVVFGVRYSDAENVRQWYLIFREFDTAGAQTQYRETLVGDCCRVQAAVRVGESYLIKLWGYTDGNYGNDLVAISAQGEITDKFSYFVDGRAYQVEDIFAFGGKVYLSALVPNQGDAAFNDELIGLMDEYYTAWESAGGTGEVKMPEDYYARLRTLFIGRYSAALLVCDENASITRAYTVENARCGGFSVSSDGLLLWQVLRIDDVRNASMMVSSHRVVIAATEFSFAFDESGTFRIEEEVGPYPMVW